MLQLIVCPSLRFVGKVKAVVDSVFAFEDALEGYDRVMTRHATGKVIVKIDSTVE